MNVLVTGAKGFIGKNLIATLHNIKEGKDRSFDIDEDINVYEYDVDSDKKLLDEYCKGTDFVFHLAGVNRPQAIDEYMEGNYGFTGILLDTLKKYKNRCPIMLASSIQAKFNNAYGISKKAGEDLLFEYKRKTGASIYVYRFPNVFGKWCRPNYNSVIATFCYNISHDLPIKINDENSVLNLCYIDDVVSELIQALKGNPNINEMGYCNVSKVYTITLGMIAELLYSFKKGHMTKEVPDMTKEGFEKKLYATYLSYMPEDDFIYSLDTNVDERGSFTEIIKTLDRGQFSVNVIKAGFIKGEHWHHTKNEKFVVVKGRGLIQLRKVGINPETDRAYPIVNYHVNGNKLQAVDIPVGYTHNIVNEGKDDLIVFIWSSECFEKNKPDTYFLKVNEDIAHE